LVGQGTRLPDYVVLISTVGGISLFGINGFVIGPLIAALFIAAWSLFAEQQSAEEQSPKVLDENSPASRRFNNGRE
jgi:predicted PurR-regulated permease PerM